MLPVSLDCSFGILQRLYNIVNVNINFYFLLLNFGQYDNTLTMKLCRAEAAYHFGESPEFSPGC
jgi:hypothetical protein